MNYAAELDRWIERVENSDLKSELVALRNSGDERAIEDSFYKDLSFGTSGLRNIIAAGPNRMNIYTVRRATQGLANYLLEQAREGFSSEQGASEQVCEGAASEQAREDCIFEEDVFAGHANNGGVFEKNAFEQVCENFAYKQARGGFSCKQDACEQAREGVICEQAREGAASEEGASADHVSKKGTFVERALQPEISVLIARDSRNKGEDFVRVTAEVLAAHGIIVYLFPRIEPTPALSFGVRHLHTTAGICITASHNPSIYNGYKVYGSDGGQILGSVAKRIQNAIDQIDIFDDVVSMDFNEAEERGLIRWVDDSVIQAFVDAGLKMVPVDNSAPVKDLSIVYTPLNGTGMESMELLFKKMSLTQVQVVEPQRMPDGDFPTCTYPNPEYEEALSLGLEICQSVKPDILLATDPDADRIGVAVRHAGNYLRLSGNEIGLLLIDYLCKCLSSPEEDCEGAGRKSNIKEHLSSASGGVSSTSEDLQDVSGSAEEDVLKGASERILKDVLGCTSAISGNSSEETPGALGGTSGALGASSALKGAPGALGGASGTSEECELSNRVVMSTIVSSVMLEALSDYYGFELRRTMTGFKNVGQQMAQLEEAGQAHRFLFAYEDASGYLNGYHVHDKDAISSAALIYQMTAHYKSQGMDLIDAVQDLYGRFGFCLDGLQCFEYLGAEGARIMDALMESLRENPPKELGGLGVIKVRDYLQGIPMEVKSVRELKPQMLAKSNVLEFQLEQRGKVIIRPSGTEPKIKVYTFAKGATEAESKAYLERLQKAVDALMA